MFPVAQLGGTFKERNAVITSEDGSTSGCLQFCLGADLSQVRDPLNGSLEQCHSLVLLHVVSCGFFALAQLILPMGNEGTGSSSPGWSIGGLGCWAPQNVLGGGAGNHRGSMVGKQFSVCCSCVTVANVVANQFLSFVGMEALRKNTE